MRRRLLSPPRPWHTKASVSSLEDTAMADKESLTGIEQGVQIEERTKHAMENYFGWLQTTMSALPWSNTNLNRILLSNATQNVTATFAFVHKLS